MACNQSADYLWPCRWCLYSIGIHLPPENDVGEANNNNDDSDDNCIDFVAEEYAAQEDDEDASTHGDFQKIEVFQEELDICLC